MTLSKHCVRGAAALLLAVSLSAQAGAYEDFFRAINTDNASGVQQLLQRGFDPNARDEKGQTALYLAMREGALKSAEQLLAHPQLQLNEANAAGETALMMAALRGRTDWVARLLDRGAQRDMPGWSPLHYAAAGPELAAVTLLLSRGAAVDAASPNGTTPLMMAAGYGGEPAVDALLAAGGSVKVRNQQGLDAADFARKSGREALAERLKAAAAK